ncbi:MAG: helix-turn-helix domain-containing protein [Patescibacteria group bacterium]
MFEKTLYNLGLSKVQAEILDCLLNQGPDKASNIAKKIKRPRGVAYKGLDELIKLNLVSKTEEVKGITIFSAEHPSGLETIADQKEKDAIKHKKEFISALPDLVSAYSLISNKPGVKFYEGEEGIEKSLNDTLASRTTIYTFADIEAVEKNIKDINDAYSKKREKTAIKKKIIIADTSFNRQFLKNFNSLITEFRFLAPEFYNFSSGVQIYDNKVSYQVVSSDNKMAIVIEDKNIYQMNKLLFEYIWENLASTIKAQQTKAPAETRAKEGNISDTN